jgi:pyruvate,water dikinase
MEKTQKHILWFKEINSRDVSLVGGKNASLGEMFTKLSKKGIKVPDGFVLTSKSYWYFLRVNKIDGKLKEIFKKFKKESFESLKKTSREARGLILKAEFPEDLKKDILTNYRKLSRKYGENCTDVAVRSSATAEDLPTASFAGQHETYLNVKGEDMLLESCKKCIASIFTERAISYREEKGFKQLKIALSVGVQKMVRSDLASSGVMFTLDTETGFQNVVLINSIWGVGEMIVKGKITPDEFYVFKPTLKQGYKPIIVKNLGRKTKKYIYSFRNNSHHHLNYNPGEGLREVKVSKQKQLEFSLTDDEILTLSRWAMKIEKHYKTFQDIEWAKDGKTGELFIVQSRPETVHTQEKQRFFEEYQLKTEKKPVLTGIAIGDKIGTGKVRVILDISKINQFKKGEILVTKMTDPDWTSVMSLASAIVTDEGGKTAHAAIISRELGIPAVVGTEKATKTLKTGQKITVDCTRGLDGRIFIGEVSFKLKRFNLDKLPKVKTKIMVNIGAPKMSFQTSFLPQNGVGLAREEFIIAEKIKVHPLALYHFNKLKNKPLKRKIEKITVERKDKKEYFVRKLAEGIAQIAAAFYPKDVIVRFSDFKTNEYRKLIGGELFEPKEENPMLGWRGASRYYDPKFTPAFLMECQAIKRARDVFGLKNIKVMVPFCRTVSEGKKVLALIKKSGLEKGKDGLRVYVMCEIPSNVILADKFLEIFDGMSIGSNDLTQLVLGIDRDNSTLQKIFDERNLAVKEMISKVIRECKKKKKYIGICGQAPSDLPDFAEFLVKEGIESISLNPDTIIKTILNLSKRKF